MNIKELDLQAQWLYKYNVNEWNKFTNEELLELAKLTLITENNPYGRAYDDEVWDEMERRGLKLNENNR